MKQRYTIDNKFFVFLGLNKLRDNEEWFGHGLKFEKGFVYSVDEKVAEYLKPIRGFTQIKGIKEEVISFKKR